MRTARYVIMGVSGSGKTTVGAMLARARDSEFVDGDDLHPPENVQRMAEGIALTDDDRRPWLLAIAVRLRTAQRAAAGLVVACSALKRSYRDVLRREGDADARFVFLKGSRVILETRMTARRGHYMPATLLDSQLATLEEPSPEEQAWVCDIDRAPDAIVADLMTRIA